MLTGQTEETDGSMTCPRSSGMPLSRQLPLSFILWQFSFITSYLCTPLFAFLGLLTHFLFLPFLLSNVYHSFLPQYRSQSLYTGSCLSLVKHTTPQTLLAFTLALLNIYIPVLLIFFPVLVSKHVDFGRKKMRQATFVPRCLAPNIPASRNVERIQKSFNYLCSHAWKVVLWKSQQAQGTVSMPCRNT